MSNWFYYLEENGLRWWLFGWGLSINDSTKRELLFSERNRLIGWRIGKWHVTYLRRM